MYKSLGPHFFRRTTEIQSGPNAFDKSRFVMTFLTIFLTILTITNVATKICSFRVGPEGKTGKEAAESSTLEFLAEFLANNYALSVAEDHTSGRLNRGVIADLLLLRALSAICQNCRELSFWEVMDSCFISICKIGSFQNPFAMITSLSDLCSRFRRFIL